MRRLAATGLAATALAVAAAGCGSSQTATQRSTSSSTPGATVHRTTGRARNGACTPGQLVPAYVGTNGATGHMEVTIALRNRSGRPCRIAGYPGARLTGPGGPLALRVAHGGGFFPDTGGRPRRILVAPGHSAHYGISFVTNNEYAGAHVCHVITGAASALPGHPRTWQPVSLARAPRLAPCGTRIVVSPIHA